MKQVLQSFISHKDLYILSISIGSVTTAISNFFVKYTPAELFGIGIAMWIIGFIINLIDIHTGIKADTVRSKKEGENFKFKSRKGWRAFEKIAVFTIIIAFLHYNEEEIARKDLWSGFSMALLNIKYVLFFYVLLVEIQSIGENQEVRYGDKPQGFKMLDKIIDVVNEGILNKLKDLFSSSGAKGGSNE